MNTNPLEIAKFSALSDQWWDTEGDLKTLHAINPLRLDYILSQISLKNKKVLDIGCGGGILAEGMAKLGAIVTGIDMSSDALAAAEEHQHLNALTIDYQLITAEEFAEKRPAEFDIVTCFELLEHVPDPESIVFAASKLVKTNGCLFFSTLNRNLKSYLFAILGAEYFLKLLPKNTHDFADFIRPSELAAWARGAQCTVIDLVGMTYSPLTKQYQLTADTAVNYIMYLQKNSLFSNQGHAVPNR